MSFFFFSIFGFFLHYLSSFHAIGTYEHQVHMNTHHRSTTKLQIITPSRLPAAHPFIFRRCSSVAFTAMSSSLSANDELLLYVRVYIVYQINSDEYSLLLVRLGRKDHRCAASASHLDDVQQKVTFHLIVEMVGWFADDSQVEEGNGRYSLKSRVLCRIVLGYQCIIEL